MKFWLPLVIDAVIAVVILYFFIAGLADGSVSSFNIIYWVGILLAVTGFIGVGLWLGKRGQKGAAAAALWILAVPGVVALCFILLVLVLSPRWN